LNEKRASIGTVHFPAVTNNQSEPKPADTTFLGPSGKGFSFPQEIRSSSAQPITQSQSAGFPVQPSPPAQLTLPQELAVQGPDREQLLHDLVRLGLVQQDGILDMFISHKLSKLVRGVFDSFQQGQFNRKIGKVLFFAEIVHANMLRYCSKVSLETKVFCTMEEHCRVTETTPTC